MEILKLIKEYWVLITFLGTMISAFFVFSVTMIAAIKCSLRNDILDIYDRCKDKKEITRYQLESIRYSHDIYKKLWGNSFVDEVVNIVIEFNLID